MTSADFCPFIRCVTTQDATGVAGRPVEQISSDKNMKRIVNINRTRVKETFTL